MCELGGKRKQREYRGVSVTEGCTTKFVQGLTPQHHYCDWPKPPCTCFSGSWFTAYRLLAYALAIFSSVFSRFSVATKNARRGDSPTHQPPVNFGRKPTVDSTMDSIHTVRHTGTSSVQVYRWQVVDANTCNNTPPRMLPFVPKWQSHMDGALTPTFPHSHHSPPPISIWHLKPPCSNMAAYTAKKLSP